MPRSHDVRAGLPSTKNSIVDDFFFSMCSLYAPALTFARGYGIIFAMDFILDDVKKDLPYAKDFFRHFGHSDMELLGQGAESNVYGMKSVAVKFFRTEAEFRKLKIEWLIPKMGNLKTVQKRCEEGIKRGINFCPILDVEEKMFHGEKRIVAYLPKLDGRTMRELGRPERGEANQTAYFRLAEELHEVGEEGFAKFIEDTVKLAEIGISYEDGTQSNHMITKNPTDGKKHISRIDLWKGKRPWNGKLGGCLPEVLTRDAMALVAEGACPCVQLRAPVLEMLGNAIKHVPHNDMALKRHERYKEAFGL